MPKRKREETSYEKFQRDIDNVAKKAKKPEVKVASELKKGNKKNPSEETKTDRFQNTKKELKGILHKTPKACH